MNKCKELKEKRKETTKEVEEEKPKKKKDEGHKLYLQNKQREEEFTKSVVQIQQKHSEFMATPELKLLFTKYDNPLKLLFGFFTKLEDFHIDRKLMMETEAIQFRTFIKVCIYFQLIPCILSTPEAVSIFRSLTKPAKRAPKKGAVETKVPHVLNFDQFKEALVKVATYGREALDSEVKKPKANTKSTNIENLEGLTVEHVEKLIKYMKLSEEDTKYTLESKFAKIKEENANAKKKSKEDPLEAAQDIENEEAKEVDKSQLKEETTEEKLIEPDGKAEDYTIEKS